MSNTPGAEAAPRLGITKYNPAPGPGGEASWRVWDSRRQFPNTDYVERIAWPAYAWRVVVPNQDTRYDPLQRAVLRLAEAHVANTGEIARLLGIHPDLARHLQLTCISTGLLDDQGQVTKSGRDGILGLDREDENAETEDGWIFRDAVSGDVLPLFYQGSLPILKRRADDTHYHLPRHPRNAARPSAAAIANALRQYRRLLRVEQDQVRPSALDKDLFDPDSPVDWSVVSESEPDREEARRKAPGLVRMVTERPERLAFEVNYYVCPDAPEAWYLTAPLSSAGGWWYRRKLEWAADRDPNLATRLASWRQTAEELFAPTEEMIISLSKVKREFAEFYACPGLGEALLWWERACASHSRHALGDFDADSVYTRCQKVLELALDACIGRIADRRALLEEIRWDPSRRFLRNIASELQVTLPQKMAWDNTGESMTKVASGEMRSLRDRALFLFYAAYYDFSHPFYRACDAEKGLLDLIDDVAELRNEYGAHSGRLTEVPDHASLIDKAINKTRCVLQTLGAELCQGE